MVSILENDLGDIWVRARLSWSESCKVVITGRNLKSLGYFGDSETPLVGRQGQIHRSFLLGCHNFQEVTKVIVTVSIGDDADHSCRQMREDSFE